MKDKILRINMAQTIDGHTVNPEGKWNLGSAEDKRRMDRLRLWADCLIASRRSIENDNPNLFVRTMPEAKHPHPVIVLNDISRKISADRRIFNHPHPPGEFWIYNSRPKTLSDLIDGYKSLTKKQKTVIDRWQVMSFESVSDITSSLSARKYRKILLEGGPSLNGIFLQEDLIDEIFFTIVPWSWGGTSTDRIITSEKYIDPVKFRLLSCERRKDEVFFRYKRIKASC